MSQPIIGIDSERIAYQEPQFFATIAQFSEYLRHLSPQPEVESSEAMRINDEAYQRLLRLTRFRWNQ